MKLKSINSQQTIINYMYNVPIEIKFQNRNLSPLTVMQHRYISGRDLRLISNYKVVLQIVIVLGVRF